ncbi:MAG TPA: DUF2271 domain-containing protein [Spirochaetota bacterium]|nr:DUF2271 domain-containing protein [Spirochaetota bacterium]
MEKGILIFLLIIIMSLGIYSDNLKREVVINYSLNRIPKIASNQIAIWIEDETGSIIRTLFVTKFTAKGGYKKRSQALKRWVSNYDVDKKTKNEIDAISGATQKPGKHSIIWNCKDNKGNSVKNGKYYYCIEGNIFWDNMVYVKGEITISDKNEKSVPEIKYSPEDAEKVGVLIYDVFAIFQ